MEIWHRLTFSSTSNIEQLLSELGILFKKTPTLGNSYLIHVDIAESNPRWGDVVKLAKSANALDVLNTTFSDEEILEADWVRICPAFEKGYPEPYSNLGWLKSTLKGVCEVCGTGFIQIAPFQAKIDINTGRNDFASLVATYTLFCTANVVQSLKTVGVRGLQFLPLYLSSMKKNSENIFQWDVSTVSQPGLSDYTNAKKCERCGVTKYQPHLRDFMVMRKESLISDVDVMRSYEWFGSGHAAYREFFISRKLVKKFFREKWRGIILKPLKLI